MTMGQGLFWGDTENMCIGVSRLGVNQGKSSFSVPLAMMPTCGSLSLGLE